MQDYRITRFITGLGYSLGIVTIALGAVIGYVLNGILGSLAFALGGVFMSLPMMMACEMAIAIVRIEMNTRNAALARQAQTPHDFNRAS